MMRNFLVVYERYSNGWGAYVPDLPGLGVVGATQEEVKRLIREGIALHIDGLKHDGVSVPVPSAESDYVAVS